MGKYFVVVNQKYIVKVESTSAGGAEHVILDGFNGIRGAQAFGKNELTTDLFAHYVETCDTVSLGELAKMSDAYDARCTALAKTMDAAKSLKERIEDTERELESMKRQLELYEAECKEYKSFVYEI